MSTPVSTLLIELEFSYAASPDQVWDTLVSNTAKWWPSNFYTGPDARMVLEPRRAGHLYEDWGHGRGRTWFTIETYDPPRSLEMSGHLYPAFGGPATTLVRLELHAAPSGTQLKLTDAVCGRADAGTRKSLEDGWKLLFGEALGGWLRNPR
jgi:uncharacterized protein YndB with AHSA1/START domain